MPLFGPNVEKMARSRDIAGLLRVTEEGSPKKRIEAVEAIAQIGDADALQKAIRFQSTDAMSGFWDETIGSVTKLPRADTASQVLLGLLVSDIKEGMQRKAFDTLTGMDTLRDGQLWYNTASTLMDSGRTALGLECLAQAVKSEPSNKEMIGAIASDLGGKAHSEPALFEPALTYFRRFTELDPEDAWGWFGQGLCLMNLELWDEAKSACLKAVEIDSSYKVARDLLASAYYSLGDYAEAASVASVTLETDPTDLSIRVLLSDALALSGRLADAESEVMKGLETIWSADYTDARSMAHVYQQLANVSVMRGHKEKAREAYRKALDSESSNEWIRELLNSYDILDMLGLSMEGTPSDRRNRLFSLARKRTQARKGQGISSDALVIALTLEEHYGCPLPASYIGVQQRESWLSSSVQEAAVKMWPPDTLAAAIKLASSQGVLAVFQQGLKDNVLD